MLGPNFGQEFGKTDITMLFRAIVTVRKQKFSDAAFFFQPFFFELFRTLSSDRIMKNIAKFGIIQLRTGNNRVKNTTKENRWTNQCTPDNSYGVNEVHFVYIWMGTWYDMACHNMKLQIMEMCMIFMKKNFSFFNYEKNIQTVDMRWHITCDMTCTWHVS